MTHGGPEPSGFGRETTQIGARQPIPGPPEMAALSAPWSFAAAVVPPVKGLGAGDGNGFVVSAGDVVTGAGFVPAAMKCVGITGGRVARDPPEREVQRSRTALHREPE